jgi:hypothetical protein
MRASKRSIASVLAVSMLVACGPTPEPVTPPAPPPPAPLASAVATVDVPRAAVPEEPKAVAPQEAPAVVIDPLAVEGANLKMASINAEGFAMTDMACKLAGGGLEMLLAGPVLAAVVGKKKAALNACAPGGADVSVRWTTAGRRVVDVRAVAGGDKKIEACVERVMRTSIATFEATCRASFHVGR